MMRKTYTLFIFLIMAMGPFSWLQAQSSEQLISDLQAIHDTIKSPSCVNQQVISNRAMNLFLSDKMGSYLTDYKSLSFYKNYITFNTGDGVFSLNHNFFQPSGTDEAVRSFYVVGVKANVTNALVSTFTDKPFSNELGVTIKKSWIGKPKTGLNSCFEKQVMDSKRASILLVIKQKIKQREQEFINSLSSLKQESLSDSDFAKVKDELRQDFYVKLTDEFSKEFASLQYQELSETARYKQITTHWTNLSVYLPVVLQRFVVAQSLARPSENKKSYPFELALSHTRLWESKKSGRFFLTVEAGVYLTNSTQSHLLQPINYDQYKRSGGIDTISLSQRKINSIFIGNFQNFIASSVKFNFVYYPQESHIGISTSLEQNMGIYKALNWSLGIPIVLIDKVGRPASNFEFQVRYFDISHVVFPNRTFVDNLSINLTIGIPFSKIIY